MNPTRRYVYLGLLTSVLPLSPPLSANENDKDIEETVVIGISDSTGLSLDAQNDASNRLGLEIIDVPGSVEIITKENIAIKGDFSSLSAVTRATGFASSASPGNGGSSVAVRGFNGHGSVVQTYDGVRLYVGAGTVTFPADTWTLDKIEVLRGPGSVINGVGAVGATVNYVPKAPSFDDVRHDLSVTAGSFDLRRIAYGSGGRITDELAYRVDAVYHESEGYVDNGDEKRQAIAGAFLYRPLENLDIKFSVDYADIEDSAYWGTPLVNGKILDSTRENNYNVIDGLVEYEDLWPRLSVKWKINEAITLRNDLYYLTATRHWRNVESYNHNTTTGKIDRSFYLEILHDQSQLGNRSDVLFDFDIGDMENRLNVGFEVNSIDFTHTNNAPYGTVENNPAVDLHNPRPGFWRDGALNRTTKAFTSDTLQYAFFLDEHLQITEQIAVIAGVRHDIIDVSREDFARDNGNGDTFAADMKDIDLSGTSWRLGAVYQPVSNLSIYGQASKAVDSIQSLLTATNPNLELTEGRQFEIGLKQQFWDNRAQYTIALFDIVKKNLLVSDPGGVQRQVGQQSSQGVEFEFFLRPTDNFDIDFNIAAVNPKYDDFGDFTDNTPRDVPKLTANLWMNWQFVDAWTLSGGLRHVGKRYANDANTSELPSYTIYDASLRWAVANDLQLSLLAKNLSDDKNFVLAPYGDQWILGEPRSAEISVNYTF
ncbi:Ferrichrome outer membrane transporter/phage receptor [BD1-7 clade bacterium]|uniref:Ferrichrome outer membrane transporter/phage receptor n=1 Tax=BD1-7 clade bacterium TaxID=2029982 RepID=A0A5S9Q7I5_9GAMM|nr:Ferrichrome outer membrane transporter/phage receptor [BD1-7 clade bacterium]